MEDIEKKQVGTKDTSSDVVEDKKSDTSLEEIGRKVAKENFLNEVFVTADGTAFKDENDARSYSKNLKKKDVVSVKITGDE